MLNLTNWDMHCPSCDNTTSFRVAIQTTGLLSSKGVEVCINADIEYDDGSDCECAVCYHDGIVADFRLSRQPNQEELVV